jgi:hypothetical protein
MKKPQITKQITVGIVVGRILCDPIVDHVTLEGYTTVVNGETRDCVWIPRARHGFLLGTFRGGMPVINKSQLAPRRA